MNQRALRFAIDSAERDVRVGWGTGAGIVALRAVALIAFLAGETAVGWPVLAQVLVQLVLAAAFTYGVYRRHIWAAIGLLIVWGLGYFYSWHALGRLLPPLGVFGLLVWYGLYRGIRGVRSSRALSAQQSGVGAAA